MLIVDSYLDVERCLPDRQGALNKNSSPDLKSSDDVFQTMNLKNANIQIVSFKIPRQPTAATPFSAIGPPDGRAGILTGKGG